MRNIVIHQVVQGRAGGSGGELEQIVVRGVAFGLRRVEVSIRGRGGGIAKQAVDCAADGEFRAVFTRSHGLEATGCRCGETLYARVADAKDLEGCYSSIETRLVCERDG